MRAWRGRQGMGEYRPVCAAGSGVRSRTELPSVPCVPCVTLPLSCGAALTAAGGTPVAAPPPAGCSPPPRPRPPPRPSFWRPLPLPFDSPPLGCCCILVISACEWPPASSLWRRERRQHVADAKHGERLPSFKGWSCPPSVPHANSCRAVEALPPGGGGGASISGDELEEAATEWGELLLA